MEVDHRMLLRNYRCYTSSTTERKNDNHRAETKNRTRVLAQTIEPGTYPMPTEWYVSYKFGNKCRVAVVPTYDNLLRYYKYNVRVFFFAAAVGGLSRVDSTPI